MGADAMKKAIAALGGLWAGLYLLCAVDGLCIVQKEAFLRQPWGNLAAGLFFLTIFSLLALANRVGSQRLLRAIRAYALGAMTLSLVLLAAWLLAWQGGAGLYQTLLTLLILVSTPLASCSVLAACIVGWSLVLVGSWMLLRRGKPPKRPKNGASH